MIEAVEGVDVGGAAWLGAVRSAGGPKTPRDIHVVAVPAINPLARRTSHITLNTRRVMLCTLRLPLATNSR